MPKWWMRTGIHSWWVVCVILSLLRALRPVKRGEGEAWFARCVVFSLRWSSRVKLMTCDVIVSLTHCSLISACVYAGADQELLYSWVSRALYSDPCRRGGHRAAARRRQERKLEMNSQLSECGMLIELIRPGLLTPSSLLICVERLCLFLLWLFKMWCDS